MVVVSTEHQPMDLIILLTYAALSNLKGGGGGKSHRNLGLSICIIVPGAKNWTFGKKRSAGFCGHLSMRKMKIIPETVKKFNSSDAYFVINVALSYPL